MDAVTVVLIVYNDAARIAVEGQAEVHHADVPADQLAHARDLAIVAGRMLLSRLDQVGSDAEGPPEQPGAFLGTPDFVAPEQAAAELRFEYAARLRDEGFTTDELAASGLGNAVFFSISVVGIGMMFGIDPMISQAIGAGDRVRARRMLWQGIWLGLVVTGVLLLVVPTFVIWRMRKARASRKSE